MELLELSILIHADKQKVWNIMLGEKSYPQWAKEFHEGSTYQGSWEKGSEIRFTAPDEQGDIKGMFSKIKENVLHQFISIEHHGFISNGAVDNSSEEAKEWIPAFENYTFTEKEGNTTLKIEMQVPAKYKSMMSESWTKALNTLKKICEQ